jgi:hypothetical protein
MNDNKLIAEFMGADDLYDGMSDARAKRIYNYHTSWDWLMHVVQKINLLDDYRYTVYIASMDTKIEDNITGNVIVDINCKHSVDELIQSVYKAVVEFIKEYKTHTT